MHISNSSFLSKYQNGPVPVPPKKRKYDESVSPVSNFCKEVNSKAISTLSSQKSFTVETNATLHYNNQQDLKSKEKLMSSNKLILSSPANLSVTSQSKVRNLIKKEANSKILQTPNKRQLNLQNESQIASKTAKSNLLPTNPKSTKKVKLVSDKSILSSFPSIKREPANLIVISQPKVNNLTKKESNAKILQTPNKRQPNLQHDSQAASKIEKSTLLPTAKSTQKVKLMSDKLILSSFPSIKREPSILTVISQPNVSNLTKKEANSKILQTPNKKRKLSNNSQIPSKTAKLNLSSLSSIKRQKKDISQTLSVKSQPRVSNLTTKAANTILSETPRGILQNNFITVSKTAKIAKKHWTTQDCENLKLGVERLGCSRWNEISKNYLNKKFDLYQCRKKYMNGLHPNLTRGKWTEEEIEKLLSGVELFGLKNWTQIGWKMFNWSRSGDHCRIKYMEHIAEKHSRWSDEEIEKLFSLYNEKKLSWVNIGSELRRGPQECRSIYHRNFISNG